MKENTLNLIIVHRELRDNKNTTTCGDEERQADVAVKVYLDRPR